MVILVERKWLKVDEVLIFSPAMLMSFRGATNIHDRFKTSRMEVLKCLVTVFKIAMAFFNVLWVSKVIQPPPDPSIAG